jgi:D-3-phosphoglycerate dehydrogenase
MRIVLCYPVDERHVEAIRKVAPDAEIVAAEQEGIARWILEADVFCGHAKVPMPWDQVVREGRLAWIQSSAAGLDHCLVPSVVASNIIVTSASGLFADQVAEHTMGLVLAMLRGLPVFFRAQQNKEFVRRSTRDLRGTRVGIVGFGGNGRRLADVLAPFHVHVYAVDLFPFDKPPNVEHLWHAHRLPDLLAAVDIVILCVPLTDLTRGMLNAQSLQTMRRGSLLVNVARGEVVVERDLVAALKSGHLWGAALDVTETEPLPPASPLWDLPNVLITPHVGAQSARRVDDTTAFFCDNLKRFLSGSPLRNQVDKSLGFPIRHADTR